MRPGLTGLAQASGRNYLDWDRRLAKDVEYVKNLSLRHGREGARHDGEGGFSTVPAWAEGYVGFRRKPGPDPKGQGGGGRKAVRQRQGGNYGNQSSDFERGAPATRWCSILRRSWREKGKVYATDCSSLAPRPCMRRMRPILVPRITEPGLSGKNPFHLQGKRRSPACFP